MLSITIRYKNKSLLNTQSTKTLRVGFHSSFLRKLYVFGETVFALQGYPLTRVQVTARVRNIEYYSPTEGIPELREAIAQKEKSVNDVTISPDDVLVTAGISEGIEMTL